jgi:hypothetical protein
MLNPRRCMQEMDTQGNVPSWVQGVKLQRIQTRLYLVEDAKLLRKTHYNAKREPTIGSILQARALDEITN